MRVIQARTHTPSAFVSVLDLLCFSATKSSHPWLVVYESTCGSNAVTATFNNQAVSFTKSKLLSLFPPILSGSLGRNKLLQTKVYVCSSHRG